MLPKMRYRLGLDIGSTSIGWCLLRLNPSDEPIAIIRMGVRIFSDGRNPKDGSSRWRSPVGRRAKCAADATDCSSVRNGCCLR